MKLIPNFIHRRIAHRPNLIKIVENIGWLFFDKILRMGVGLFVGVWIARYLGPEQFGLLNFATAFVGLFSAISVLGLQSIVVRNLVRDPQCRDETLGTAAVLQFVGGLLAYGFIIAAIFWMRADDQLSKTLVAILGATMLFKASDVAMYWFESQVQSKYTVWVQNGVFLIFTGINVALIMNNAPLIAFAWVMTAQALIVALSLLIVLGLRGPGLRLLQARMSRAKSLLADSWPLFLSSIAVMIYMKIDQIMLGQMIGDEAVGIYSAAVRISEVWYFVPMSIVASVFPAILEAKKRSEEQYYRQLQQLYDLMVWLAIAIAIPLTFLATPIVTLLFGSAYEQAGTVLSIHIWAAVFVFLGVASGKWFLAENRQILSLQRTALGAVVNIAVNSALIPLYGVRGAAWATVISYATAALLADLVQLETRKMFLMKMQTLNILKVICRIQQ
ncbi:flippase [Methylotuvimicrobium sp. KM1]|uniref:flippase n=1 Tax=Methylotuvimicrobium sp. KM1 TaxID=3377707 RepID=UPI00384A72E1